MKTQATPRTQRVFIDVTALLALGDAPPNKVTRCHDLLTRFYPEAQTGRLSAHEFALVRLTPSDRSAWSRLASEVRRRFAAFVSRRSEARASDARSRVREARTALPIGSMPLCDEDTLLVIAGCYGAWPERPALEAMARARSVTILLGLQPLACPALLPERDIALLYQDMLTIARSSQALVVPDAATAALLRTFLDATTVDPPPIHVIPLPLGLSIEGQTSRPALRTADARPFALAIAAFKHRKNIDWVVAAWQLACSAPSVKSLRLLLVCSKIDESLADLVVSHPAFGQDLEIIFAPSDAELRWLLREATLLIQPPSMGGLGSAIIEALSAGKPVLCANEDRPDACKDDPSITTAEPDLKAWSDALVALSDASRDTRIAAADVGRRRAAQERACRAAFSDVLDLVSIR